MYRADTTERLMLCPISHRRCIKHPVTIRNVNEKTVYEAEFIVQWLKHHRLMDPVTHKWIAPGLACHILRPYGKDDGGTQALLVRAGYLDGRGGKVWDCFRQRIITMLTAAAVMLLVFCYYCR